MNINLDNISVDYKIKLAYLNEVEVGELSSCYDLSYAAGLVEISELSFSLPSIILDSRGAKIQTPGYEELEADMLVVLEDDIYFYIDSCVETQEEGRAIKTIHAYSREYELSFKSFNNYNPETERFLYFKLPSSDTAEDGFPWTTFASMPKQLRDALKEKAKGDKDPDGYFYGIFNQIEELTQWKIKRYSSGNPIIPSLDSETSGKKEWLAPQARSLSTSESNLLELMKQIQEAWGVFFNYDTKNKIISIQTMQDLLVDKDGNSRPAIGLLSDTNFIEKITKEQKKQDIKTRLYLYNRHGDGVTAALTGHGQPFVEDYSYYRTPKYMSSNLLLALEEYDRQIKAAQPIVEESFNQLLDLFEEQTLVSEEIRYLNEFLSTQISKLAPLRIIQEGYKNGTEVILEPGELNEEQKAEYDFLTKNIAEIKSEIEKRLGPIGPKPVKTDYFYVTVRSEDSEDGYKTFALYGGYYNLETLDSKITEIKDFLKLHQERYSMKGVFQEFEENNSLPIGSLIYEMDPYIKEATYKSDYLEDPLPLQDLGLKLIKGISSPKTQVSLEVFDFLSLVDFVNSWHLVSLGDILKIENERLNFSQSVLLLKYTHSPSSNTLTLEFSEDLVLASDVTYIASLITKSASVASQVSFNSSIWGGTYTNAIGGSGSGVPAMELAKEIRTELLVTDKIVAAVAEIEHIITDRIDAVTANIDSLVAGTIDANSVVTDVITTNLAKIDFAQIGVANIDKLIAGTAFIEILTAKEAFIDKLTANEAFIDRLTASEIFVDKLTASEAFIDKLSANTAFIGNLTADIVTSQEMITNFLKADLANIDVGVIKTILGNDLLVTNGHIANLKVGDAEIVSLNAAKIIAGTISAEKIMLRGTGPNGEQGLLLGLNNLGELVSTNVDSLDGYVLTNNSVHAEKIIAESITAREIATNTISADRLLAGTITAASAAIASLDASKITVGTLDASKVAIANLSATSIKTGLLESINGAFFLNMETGDFNLGGAVIKNGNIISITAGGVPIEDYVDGRMLYLIKSNPEQIFINTTHDGDIEESQSFSLDFSIYKGTALKAATITGVHLQNSGGQVISTASFSSSAINPTEGGLGKLNLTFGTGTNLPVDTGYVQCLITVTENSKQFFYKISWSKVKAPAKQYRIEVISSNGEIFKNNLITTTLKAFVYEDNLNITNNLPASRFQWTKTLKDGELDISWNTIYASGYKQVPVTASDISERATFSCSII